MIIILKENYELFVDNIEDYIRLCDLEKKSYLEIEEIRVELNKYKYTKDDEIKGEIIENVVTIYKDKLIQLLNEILHLKYSDPEVICDTDDNSYKLVEIPKKYKTIYNEFSLLPISIKDNITHSHEPSLKSKQQRKKEILEQLHLKNLNIIKKMK